MRKHPSGRPIRRPHFRPARSIPRPPFDEPLTPGLRERGLLTPAIGFHADLIGRDDDYEEE